jgi:hypothetical protein
MLHNAHLALASSVRQQEYIREWAHLRLMKGGVERDLNCSRDKVLRRPRDLRGPG